MTYEVVGHGAKYAIKDTRTGDLVTFTNQQPVTFYYEDIAQNLAERMAAEDGVHVEGKL